MASSENQGLQIAVIIFILLVVVLGVTSVLLFSRGTESYAQAETEKKRALEAEANLRRQVDLVDGLKTLIGFQAEDDKAAVDQAFEGDMGRLGERLSNAGYPLPTDGKTYRKALEHLITSIEAVHANLATKEQEIEQLKQVNIAFEAAKNKELEQFRAQAQKAEADLAAAMAKFNDDLRAKDQELANVRGMIDTKNQEMVAAVSNVEQQVQVLDRKQNDAEAVIARYASELNELTGKTYVEYDGEVTRSNVATGTVWINVGSADYLRRRVAFSVYPPDAPAGGNVPAKATIEVTQILGDHLAEAKVVQENPLDPILPGDKIITPLWRPGRQTRYAIAGRFDLDRDGREDLDRLKQLVTLGGGVIDAELMSDGTINGELYVGTQFLILGDMPSERARPAYEQMKVDAKRYGTQIIPLSAFLDQIGYGSDPRQLVQYGPAGNAYTIPPEMPDGGQRVSPGNTTDVFKQRRPPSAIVGGGSAY